MRGRGEEGKRGGGEERTREKGEGRREKGEGRREKGEGRREKGEGRLRRTFVLLVEAQHDDVGCRSMGAKFSVLPQRYETAAQMC